MKSLESLSTISAASSNKHLTDYSLRVNDFPMDIKTSSSLHVL